MGNFRDNRPAIIFDFGAVLLDISYQATTEAMQRLLGDGVTYSKRYQDDIFDLFETGEISAAEFRNRLRLISGRDDISDEQIDQAWNAMLGGLPQERIALLETLSSDFRLFLLSNTNEIHKTAFDQTLKIAFDGDPDGFEKLFEATYYSHLIGYRKPDAQAYSYILDNHQLQAEKTWFIDDNLQNIEGARQLAINTVHLTEDLMDWYRRTGQRLIYQALQ